MATGPFWHVVSPVARDNLITNPSLERGTTGWGTIQAGTIGTASNVQQFGAWSGSIAPTANGTTGAISPTFTAGNGTDYVFSAYVRGANGIPYKLGVGDSNGVNLVGSINFTGGGTWARYAGSWTEASGVTRRMVIQKAASADLTAFYIDGAQVEAGSLTTLIDGDQDGCFWQGAPHNSKSTRSGTYAGGGSVMLLQKLGLIIDEEPGVGMSPVENTSHSHALLAGDEFQRQRALARPFVLQATFVGTTTQDLHITRRTVFNELKIDALDPPQPTRFYYSGAEGTVQIDAVYAGGGEFTKRAGFTEVTPLRFIAHDPFWYAPTQQGTSLAPRTYIGSANYIIQRDPLGRWGTMGVSGTTIQGVPGGGAGGIVDILAWNGTVFACGSFGTAGGTKSVNIAMYTGAANTWGTLGVGTIVDIGGAVYKMQMAPFGSLYVGGYFLNTNGTATRTIAQWNSAGWGSLPGGTLGTSAGPGVRSLVLSQQGTLFVTGVGLVSAAGTVGTMTFFWYSGSWGTLANGSTSGGGVYSLAMGRDNKLYAGGAFTAVGGTTTTCVASWNGTWGTLGGGIGQHVDALAVLPDARIVAAGNFVWAGAGSVNNIAVFNGVQWFPVGSGVAISSGGVSEIFDIYADQRTGDVYAGGIFNSAGSMRTPDGAARWNGYQWLPLDIDLAATANGTYFATEISADGTLYASGTFAGTAQAASVAQIVNSGMSPAFPTIKIRYTGAGTTRLYQIANTTPGVNAGIYFNALTLQPQEEVTLKSTPGALTLTSDFAGNLFNRVAGGSNLTGFKIMPGTNWISLFCDSDSVSASVVWTPRSESADGGTVY